MDELSKRRKRLFSGAKFSSAIFYNGDRTKGGSANFRYFSGCEADGCYLILKRDGGMLLTSEMNCRQARALSHYPVKVVGKNAAREIGMEAGRGKCAFSPDEMNARRYIALRKKAKLKLVDESSRIGGARGRKSSGEVKALAASARVAKKILGRLNPWKCRTELELACALKKMALDEGAEISFEPIVATGANSARPHHIPEKRKLGNFVLVDFGVRLDGYCSDFTRCYFRGECRKEREAYEKCRQVLEGMRKGLSGCRTGADVTRLAEKLMKENGLPKLAHAIGHGIGLEVHEYPRLNANSKDAVEGAALAIEPAAYFAAFGVRYEMMVAGVLGKWREI